VTEEIYQTFYAEEVGYTSINLSPWPKPDARLMDEETERKGDLIMALITEVRREKSEKHMPLNTQIKKLTIYAGKKDTADMIIQGREDISGTVKAPAIEILPEKGEGRVVKPYDIHFVAEY
jgi:valyl-tRNA synthetase